MFHFQVLFHYSVSCVRDVVHYHVQIHLVWLVAISIKALPHLHAIRMVKHLEDGELSVLVPLVLEDLLDGNGLASFGDGGLEDDSERSITDDFFCVVGHALQ